MSDASSKVTFVVEGVRSLDRIEDSTCDVTLIVDKNAPVSSVWDMLKDLGYQPPVRLDRGTEFWTKYSEKWGFHPHTEVEIVTDRSLVDDTHACIDEPLVAHTNRNREVTFDIADELVTYEGEDSSAESTTLRAKTLLIDDGLSITFHRTVRMPDDDRLHSLPPSVGAFPLYNVADYAGRLPEKITDKGGVFLPMWQREALWINFNSLKSKEYAIRVYLGKINAVTGNSMMGNDSSENVSLGDEQDYVIVPGQQWIDGVCVAPGIVRQFVAMPLGSGYTVEGQKTGEEKHGGIQLEIIPSYARGFRNWLKEETPEVLNNPFAFLDELKTPEELGLKPGDKILLYAEEALYSRPHIVGDLILQDSSGHDIDPISVKAFHLPKRKPIDWENETKSAAGFGICGIPCAARIPCARIMEDSSWASKGALHELVSPPAEAESPGFPESSALESAPMNDNSSIIVHHEMGSFDSTRSSPGPDAAPGFPSNFDCDLIMAMPQAAHEERHSMFSPPKMPTPPPAPSLNIKAMGLAAGGKLIQDIVSDYNPPEIWDVGAARIINIHILDPASCEQVTHIVPPPVPISAYKAIEAQLPFFVVEEQIDNRLEGGDFDNVKSVAQMDEAKGASGEPSSDPNVSTMCQSCEKRLCDCVIRPCDHQFCNVCIQALEKELESGKASQVECPRCKSMVAHVAGFAAPMNLPGEESIRTKMPVHVLKVEDGRLEFESIRKMRI